MAKHFISSKDESPRMFKSDFLELFSKVHWTVPLVIYVPVIAYFSYSSISNGINFLMFLMIFVLGFFFWTLTEYILHRFIFHFQPKSNWGKRIHWMFHGVHHDYPQDSFRLVMPPSVSIPLAFLFYFLFYSIIPIGINEAFFSGFVLGYLTYDISHFAIHHFAFRNKFLLKLKTHHMKHHYTDPSAGYGVSSPIWDYVFGTKFKK
jgi:4-hydroxysphinganine ceramide fatty acyl 2-hydroxylase